MKGKFTRHPVNIVTHRVYNQEIQSYYLEASSVLISLSAANSYLTTVEHKQLFGFKQNPPQAQRLLRITRAIREFLGTTLPKQTLAAKTILRAG